MVKPKAFDCMQMKHDIQEQLLKEMAGLSSEERRKRTQDQISADPILGPVWRNALSRQNRPTVQKTGSG